MRKRGNFNVPLRVHMVVVVVVVMLIITFHSSYTDCRSKCNCIWMCTHNVWQCVCVFIVCVCVSFCLFFNFLYVLTVQYDYFSHPFNLLSVSGPIISSWLSFHEANADQCDSFVRHIANGWCWIFFFSVFVSNWTFSKKVCSTVYFRNNFSVLVFSLLEKYTFFFLSPFFFVGKKLSQWFSMCWI